MARRNMDENNQHGDDLGSNAKTARRSGGGKKVMRWVVLIVILLGAIAGAIYMVMSGRMVIVVKQPSDKVLTITNVCSHDMIATYNQQMSSSADADATSRTAALESLTELSATIAAKADYQKDPSCVYMRFGIAVGKVDYATAKEMADVLEVLANEDRFPSNAIDGLMGMGAVRSNVALINLGDDE